MLKPGQLLSHPVDFDNAMLFAVPITVWLNGEILEDGKPIEKRTDDTVYVNGYYYLINNCQFKVC